MCVDKNNSILVDLPIEFIYNSQPHLVLTFEKEGKRIKIFEKNLILIKIGSRGAVISYSYIHMRPVDGRDAVKELVNSDHVPHTLYNGDGDYHNSLVGDDDVDGDDCLNGVIMR